MAETKSKTPRKRGRPEDRERFRAVLLKSHAPQLFIDYVYPKTKNNQSNRFVVRIIHPNYFKKNPKNPEKYVLWEKTYPAKTPMAKMVTEANERLSRLKKDKKNKTWVNGMEEFDKTLPQPGEQ